jgi:anamorsin
MANLSRFDRRLRFIDNKTDNAP